MKMKVKQWEESSRAVKDEATPKLEPRLEKRISTFISRFGYTFEDVLNKIIDDSMFASHFAKEPRRTGMHEKLASDWIKNNIKGILNFEVLPKAGINALKVTSDGNIETETKDRVLPGKSLDFTWTVSNYKFYASHKYTKEGGGNQDSQYKEMLELMKRFQRCNIKNIVLVIIVDGQYYNDSNDKRLIALKELEKDRPPKSYAIQIQDLQKTINSYINNN